MKRSQQSIAIRMTMHLKLCVALASQPGNADMHAIVPDVQHCTPNAFWGLQMATATAQQTAA